MVGRLRAEKNHQLLLEVADRVRRTIDAVRFLIVGDGELREDLEALRIQARLLVGPGHGSMRQR